MKNLILTFVIFGLLLSCRKEEDTTCWIRITNMIPNTSIDIISYNGEYANFLEKDGDLKNGRILFGSSVWLRVEETNQGSYPISFTVYWIDGTLNRFKTLDNITTIPGKEIYFEINGVTPVQLIYK